MEKYPRTPHFHFSPGIGDDDLVLHSFEHLIGQEIVITEKLDGGNCCLKDGHVFARSHSAPTDNLWFSYTKSMYRSVVQYLVPNPAFALFGENMEAVHSINYTPAGDYALPSSFFLFGVLNRETNDFLSWDEVVEVAQMTELPTVPLLFRGTLNHCDQLQQLIEDGMKSPSAIGPTDPQGAPREGFVVRTVDRFSADQFDRHVAKFVRQGHVQTNDDFRHKWTRAKIRAGLA